MLRLLIPLIAILTALTSSADNTGTPPLPGNYLEEVEKSDKAVSDMKWAEAINHIDRAMRIDPSNPNNVLLMSNKGMLQFYSGEDSLAIETLTIAHNIAPVSTTVLQNRAKVYMSAGLITEAIADYTSVTRLDSSLVEPRFYLSMLYFQTGDTSRSRAEIEFMKRNFPDHQSTILANATYQAYTGNFSEAIPLLSQLIEKTPTAADLSTRAMCYLMTGQLQEASDDIARGLKLDPVDGDLYLYRAMLNKMRYRPDDAKADADKARLYGVSASRIKALGL